VAGAGRLGSPLHQFGHQSCIVAVAVSPDGKAIATGGLDATARVWDAATGKELRRLGEHNGWAGEVCYSRDGRLLASSSHGLVFVREAATGKVVWRLPGRRVAFSPDSKLLATVNRDPRSVAWVWSDIRLWDLATGRELRRLVGHRANIDRLAFSPDGRFLASAGRASPYPAEGGKEDSRGRPICLWDVASGRPLFQFGAPHEYVYALAFTPDGKTLIWGGDQPWDKGRVPIRLWETATGKERGQLPGHRDTVYALALAPDGRTLASGGKDGTARLWDLHTGKELRRLKGHRGPVAAVAFGPRGRTLVTGGWDTTALVWDVADLVGRGRLPKIDPVPGGR
jgi:WD40 repeat protein